MVLSDIQYEISQSDISKLTNIKLPCQIIFDFYGLKTRFKSNSPALINNLARSFSFFSRESQSSDIEILLIEKGPLSSRLIFVAPEHTQFIYQTDNGTIAICRNCKSQRTTMTYLGTSPRIQLPSNKVKIIENYIDNMKELFFLADFLSTITITNRIKRFLFFHAACLGWQKKGVILAGETNSGKTTLSLGLAGNGFDFLSDEVTCLNLDNHKLMSFPKIICLRKKTLSFFKPVINSEPEFYRDSSGEERWLAIPRDLGIKPAEEVFPPQYFFILKGFKKRPLITPAKPREALWYALSSSYARIADGPGMLLALSPIFDRMKCYHLWPGEVEETLELIKDLIGRKSWGKVNCEPPIQQQT